MTRVKTFLYIQTILLLLLVFLLCASAVKTYRNGAARKAEHPLETIYEPEQMARTFAPMIPLFVITIGMTAVGLLLGIQDANAKKPVPNAEQRRDFTVSLIARTDETMRSERMYQKKVSILGWSAFFACMVPVAVFVLNGDHFPADPEKMIAGLARVLIPWTGVGIGCLMIKAALLEKSFCRETDAAKTLITSQKAAEHTIEDAEIMAAKHTIEDADTMTAGAGNAAHRGNRQVVLQTVFLAAAVVLILIGIYNGSSQDVLIKTINICTECIGLG